jgi:hypothetical protein
MLAMYEPAIHYQVAQSVRSEVEGAVGADMKKNLRQIENLQDKIAAIPEEEWFAAARIVIEQKRQETGIANWVPKPLNGRREFEERTLAMVEERRRQARGCERSALEQ